jgi:hypothetical protein
VTLNGRLIINKLITEIIDNIKNLLIVKII